MKTPPSKPPENMKLSAFNGYPWTHSNKFDINKNQRKTSNENKQLMQHKNLQNSKIQPKIKRIMEIDLDNNDDGLKSDDSHPSEYFNKIIGHIEDIVISADFQVKRQTVKWTK